MAPPARTSETTPIPAAAERGTPEQRALLDEESRMSAYRSLIRDFFRPSRGQARWIDPRPLPDARSAAAEDQERADDAWAAKVVAAVAHPRVCALEGEDRECRGRPGGVVRLSAPYAIDADTILVLARFATVHAGEDPSTAASTRARGGPELQFWLARRGQGWKVVREATLQEPR